MMPKTLALMAVQRQTAASASRTPLIREQQGSFGGAPSVRASKPLSTLAHTPNLRASIGQVPPPGAGCGVGLGLGLGLGLGIGGIPHSPHAETRVKKRRFRTRKRARDDLENLAMPKAQKSKVFGSKDVRENRVLIWRVEKTG